MGRGSGLHDPRPGSHLWHHRHTSIARHGHSGQANCTSLTLAEWLCRTVDRIDPARVLGPRYCFGRGTSASDSEILCQLLQLRQNASVFAQGCADFSPGSADRKHQIVPHPRRTTSPLYPGLGFRYTQGRQLRQYGNMTVGTPSGAVASRRQSWTLTSGQCHPVSSTRAKLVHRRSWR